MVSLFKIIDVKEEGVEFDAGSLVSSQQQKKTQRRDKGRGGRENRKKQKRPLEDKGGGGEQAKAIVVRKGEARSGDIGLHQEKKEDDESLMVDPFLNTKKGEKEGQTHEGAKEGSNNSMAILLTPEKSIHMQVNSWKACTHTSPVSTSLNRHSHLSLLDIPSRAGCRDGLTGRRRLLDAYLSVSIYP